MEEIQRALGVIQGTQSQTLEIQKIILQKIDDLTTDLRTHKSEDRESFQIIGSRVGSVYEKLDEQDEKRDASFKSMEKQVGVINGYIDNIRGAWWLITLLTIVIGSLGAADAWFVGLLPKPH